MISADAQYELDSLDRDYVFSTAAFYLDAVGEHRPDFLGGNCLEHARKVAEIVEGRALITEGHDHVVCVKSTEDSLIVLDTSLGLSKPLHAHQEERIELPFSNFRNPAWYSSRGVIGGRLSLEARQACYPRNFRHEYIVDLEQAEDTDLDGLIAAIRFNSLNIIARDPEGLIQLGVLVDGSSKILGRASSDFGPMVYRSSVTCLLKRMGRRLDVSPIEVEEVLHNCAAAFIQFQESYLPSMASK